MGSGCHTLFHVGLCYSSHCPHQSLLTSAFTPSFQEVGHTCSSCCYFSITLWHWRIWPSQGRIGFVAGDAYGSSDQSSGVVCGWFHAGGWASDDVGIAAATEDINTHVSGLVFGESADIACTLAYCWRWVSRVAAQRVCVPFPLLLLHGICFFRVVVGGGWLVLLVREACRGGKNYHHSFLHPSLQEFHRK